MPYSAHFCTSREKAQKLFCISNLLERNSRVNSYWVNVTDLTPFLLLLLLGLTLGSGITMTMLLHRRRRVSLPRCVSAKPMVPFDFLSPAAVFSNRPPRWVVVKSHNVPAVQRALGLHNAKPCPWQKGLAGEEKLFIAPPINGWILVVGLDLPDPNDDVDACFHFVTGLSRKLGQVQLFTANRVLYDHGWVRAENGKVLRAYAWANRTLWNQGARTPAERELDLACFDYGESSELNSWHVPDVIISNVDKVPLLAARWSLDPAAVDERFLGHAHGVAGEK